MEYTSLASNSYMRCWLGVGFQVVTDNPHLEDPTPLLVLSHLVLRYLFIERARLDGEERGERGEEERRGRKVKEGVVR